MCCKRKQRICCNLKDLHKTACPTMWSTNIGVTWLLTLESPKSTTDIKNFNLRTSQVRTEDQLERRTCNFSPLPLHQPHNHLNIFLNYLPIFNSVAKNILGEMYWRGTAPPPLPPTSYAHGYQHYTAYLAYCGLKGNEEQETVKNFKENHHTEICRFTCSVPLDEWKGSDSV
jgi:hypothetical protein